jgi:negative regulator of sigma E activity
LAFTDSGGGVGRRPATPFKTVATLCAAQTPPANAFFRQYCGWPITPRSAITAMASSVVVTGLKTFASSTNSAATFSPSHFPPVTTCSSQ